MRSNLDIKKIIDLHRKGESTHSIAEKLHTYPNKVRRTLIKAGEKLRDKSEAQVLALSSGRHKHPTKGTHRDESTKLSIAHAVHNHWENMTVDEKEERVDKAKAQWAAMTNDEKENLRELAAKAVREAAKDGSKLEKFIKKYLTSKGFQCIMHHAGLIPSEKLEVDLFIPALNVAIEIDGPTHFLPIWGEKNLQQNIKSDNKKSGLLLARGYYLIRVKCVRKHVSNIQMIETAQRIEEELDDITSSNSKFIEIEV